MPCQRRGRGQGGVRYGSVDKGPGHWPCVEQARRGGPACLLACVRALPAAAFEALRFAETLVRRRVPTSDLQVVCAWCIIC